MQRLVELFISPVTCKCHLETDQLIYGELLWLVVS